jgi:hypothetical protein
VSGGANGLDDQPIRADLQAYIRFNSKPAFIFDGDGKVRRNSTPPFFNVQTQLATGGG